MVESACLQRHTSVRSLLMFVKNLKTIPASLTRARSLPRRDNDTDKKTVKVGLLVVKPTSLGNIISNWYKPHYLAAQAEYYLQSLFINHGARCLDKRGVSL